MKERRMDFMKKLLVLVVMAAAAVAVRAQPQMTPTDTPTVDAKKADKAKDAKAGDKAPASTAPAAAGAVKVEKIVVSSGVDKRDPVGEGTAFSGGPVYCWTKLSVTNPPAKVK